MIRNPYGNPAFPDDGQSCDPASPVVDPGPEITFPAADEVINTAKRDSEEGKAAAGANVPGQCPLCAEAEKSRLLALADLDNARKRLQREKEEFMRYAGETVLADILPALDNLDLALAYAPEGKECQNFVVGVDMTRKLLLDALKRHGLEQVGELGENFNPAVHEAMGMEPSDKYVSGQVCCLMSKGYRLKDRLLRPAKVTVCKNE